MSGTRGSAWPGGGKAGLPTCSTGDAAAAPARHTPTGLPTRPGPVSLFSFAEQTASQVAVEPGHTFMSFVLVRSLCAYIFLSLKNTFSLGLRNCKGKLQTLNERFPASVVSPSTHKSHINVSDPGHTITANTALHKAYSDSSVLTRPGSFFCLFLSV